MPTYASRVAPACCARTTARRVRLVKLRKRICRVERWTTRQSNGATRTLTGRYLRSAPLAARLTARVAPRLLALLGAGGMAIGQVLIGTADAMPNIPILVAAMVLQGVGVGLFQVAYFDIVTASIPRADRGVAGSLVMMTRTLGTVTGATVLMLLFQTWRDSALTEGAQEIPAFIAGFGFTFRVAAALPAVVVILGLLRGWGGRRS